MSAFSVEGTKQCLCTFSRGGLYYISALSVKAQRMHQPFDRLLIPTYSFSNVRIEAISELIVNRTLTAEESLSGD